jgi:hypothetical protein
MVKGFILVLLFESAPGVVAIQHMEFATRASCNSARVMIEAKAEQLQRPVDGGTDAASPPARGDAKRGGQKVLRLHDAFCVEK